MNAAEEVLLAEYNQSVEVANHIDNHRNVLTSFFLTLNGGVLVAASLVLKGEVNNTVFGSAESFLAVLLISVALLGTLFVATIARMRRVQIERYRIQNRILDNLLLGELRAVIPYTDKRLGQDAGGSGMNKRTTGSYLWTLAIVLPSSALAGFAISLMVSTIHHLVSTPFNWIVGGLGGVAVFALNDLMYFSLSAFESLQPRKDH